MKPGTWLFGAILALTPLTATAQNEDSEWQYSLGIYMFGSALDGDVQVAGQTAEVDLSFSDILDNLELSAMGFLRAEKGRWAIMGDTIFFGLGASSERPPADIDVDEFVFEIDGAYRVSDAVEVLFGARYVSIDTRIDTKGPLGLRFDDKNDWVDPVAGLRITAPFLNSWAFIGRFDLAGFGVGSDLSWHLDLHLHYRTSDRFSFAFGYRTLDIDYDDGTGLDRFVYDVAASGPDAALVIHF